MEACLFNAGKLVETKHLCTMCSGAYVKRHHVHGTNRVKLRALPKPSGMSWREYLFGRKKPRRIVV